MTAQPWPKVPEAWEAAVDEGKIASPVMTLPHLSVLADAAEEQARDVSNIQ